ncbi:MAG: methylated-DNA--[protein]-cysteine S-methyltransferase [Myxococcales bacterium]|nr:methylated-DNA--[protein]-cysteine S-methyltransferase [Myxococcales bacterium]
MEALRRHVAEGVPSLNVPIDVRGTAFQLRVWNFLKSIPPGAPVPYRHVAEAVGRPAAIRAAANACAANTIALVIPCHRVIRGDGGLGGYRWGLERKRALLEREATKACRQDGDLPYESRPSSRRRR